MSKPGFVKRCVVLCWSPSARWNQVRGGSAAEAGKSGRRVLLNYTAEDFEG